MSQHPSDLHLQVLRPYNQGSQEIYMTIDTCEE
jgi:hypothetical protein